MAQTRSAENIKFKVTMPSVKDNGDSQADLICVAKVTKDMPRLVSGLFVLISRFGSELDLGRSALYAF